MNFPMEPTWHESSGTWRPGWLESSAITTCSVIPNLLLVISGDLGDNGQLLITILEVSILKVRFFLNEPGGKP